MFKKIFQKSYLLSFMIVFCLSINLIFTTSTASALDIPPFVMLNTYEKTLKIGDEFFIVAITSNGKFPKFKSSNSKVASVNTYGMVTAKKAGSAKITVKTTNAEASCKIKVNKTTIELNKKSLSLERGESFSLTAKSSTNTPVTFKVNRSSIVSITDDGVITALKPGEATVTAMADSTKVTCKVTVRKPKVTLSKTSLTLEVGESYPLTATVSSNVPPTWKSSKKSVALITEEGVITALKKGTTVITAKVDGVTKLCQVTVKDTSAK